MSSELMYKEKYLKYKEKYFKLKTQMAGEPLFGSSIGSNSSSSLGKRAMLYTGSVFDSGSASKLAISDLYSEAEKLFNFRLQIIDSIQKVEKLAISAGGKANTKFIGMKFRINDEGEEKELTYQEMINFIGSITSYYKNLDNNSQQKNQSSSNDNGLLAMSPTFLTKYKTKEDLVRISLVDWNMLAKSINTNYANFYVTTKESSKDVATIVPTKKKSFI
jgi:hypothetical protein